MGSMRRVEKLEEENRWETFVPMMGGEGGGSGKRENGEGGQKGGDITIYLPLS